MGNFGEVRPQIKVHKGRTVIITVSLGYDVSGDVITSEIRENKDPESPLIATCVVSFLSDGTDGELVLTLDDAVTSVIEQSTGYMDMKRLTAGEPVAVFDEPLEVIFRETVTA